MFRIREESTITKVVKGREESFGEDRQESDLKPGCKGFHSR